jgi:hypothetical protein
MNFKENLKLATDVTRVTLVGFFGEYPRERGNCFSVSVDDERDYRIINFNHENLEKLIEDGVVSFPIKISKLEEGIAIIADERIPDEWYSKRFCETCTPENLLPIPQRLKHHLDIERGIREEKFFEIGGQKIKAVSIKVEPRIVNIPIQIKTSGDIIQNEKDNDN